MLGLVNTLRKISDRIGDAISQTLDKAEMRAIKRETEKKEYREAAAMRMASRVMAHYSPGDFQALGQTFINGGLKPSKYFDSSAEYNAFVYVWNRVKIEGKSLPQGLPGYY